MELDNSLSKQREPIITAIYSPIALVEAAHRLMETRRSNSIVEERNLRAQEHAMNRSMILYGNPLQRIYYVLKDSRYLVI
jgi:hypothetical protein